MGVQHEGYCSSVPYITVLPLHKEKEGWVCSMKTTAQQHTTLQCCQLQAALQTCHTCPMPSQTEAAHAGLHIPWVAYLLTCEVSIQDHGHAAQKRRHSSNQLGTAVPE